MFHIFLFLRWRVHGPATSTAGSTRQPRPSISGTDVSWLLAGPTVAAQFGPGFVIVHPIDESHLCQMGGPVSMARLSVQFFSSGDLLRRGWWFGLWRLLFLFCCSTFSFALQNFFSVLHVPLRCFAKSGSLLGILNKTGSCLGSLSISIVLSANHSPRSRDGAGGNLTPMGVHPSSSSCSSNPSPDHHLSPFHQSPDDHLIRFHPFEIM